MYVCPVCHTAKETLADKRRCILRHEERRRERLERAERVQREKALQDTRRIHARSRRMRGGGNNGTIPYGNASASPPRNTGKG